jgi:hypothetical protein
MRSVAPFPLLAYTFRIFLEKNENSHWSRTPPKLQYVWRKKIAVAEEELFLQMLLLHGCEWGNNKGKNKQKIVNFSEFFLPLLSCSFFSFLSSLSRPQRAARHPTQFSVYIVWL